MSGGSGADRFRSPLRYPGGKGKIANYLKLVILENGLLGCDYIEPYAGGAGAGLSLLFEEYVDTVHINDIDPGVHAFWSVVTNSPESLVDRIEAVDVTMDEWRIQREIQRAEDISELELAFSTFFLNRTNRSGIITGGPIGGVRQAGRWKLNARFNKSDLIHRIERIARFRNRITVTGLDAADLLSSLAGRGRPHTLVYADPPYFVRGGDLYRSFYDPSDHEMIAQHVGCLTTPWIVSYDNIPEVVSLYADYQRVEYSLSYSAAERVRGLEVLFASHDLVLPDIASPANIRSSVVHMVRSS